MPLLEGHLDARGLKVALVAARWNEAVTSRLITGAVDALVRHGADEKQIDIVRVPGSFELAQAASRVIALKRYDAVVALGCLVRGETPHFDVLAAEAARGLAEVASASGLPLVFGVLTCDTMEQAIDRAGGKAGNKGWDAAMAAIEMVSLYRRLA